MRSNDTNAAATPLLALIDASSWVYRAHFALPALTRADGMPVSVIQGFCTMLDRTLRDLAPTHAAAIFDAPGSTFRHRLFPQYKATRNATPEEIVLQAPFAREGARAFGVATPEPVDVEADDLIGAYAKQAQALGWRVAIVSTDKDLMQLVDATTTMMDTMRHRVIDVAGVRDKLGVAPTQVADFLALAGDSSDNIPGVPGVGAKTAAMLLNEHGDLESVLAAAATMKPSKRREMLLAHAEDARMCLTLTRLCDVVPEAGLDSLRLSAPDLAARVAFLERMGLKSLTRRIAASSPALASPELALTPPSGATPATKVSYEVVRDLASLDRWIARAHASGLLAFDTETDGLDPMRARLAGISLATAPEEACYIPFLAPEDEAGARLDEAPTLARLAAILVDPQVRKIAHNAKFDLLMLRRRGLDVRPLDDTMLMSYALDNGRVGAGGSSGGGHGLDATAVRILGTAPIPYAAVAGTGAARLTFPEIALDVAAPYAAEDADIALRLDAALRPRLVREGMAAAYAELERPMPDVLATMEARGIRINPTTLDEASQDFGKRLRTLETEIHELAQCALNPNSPQQVAETLFGRMGLPGGRRTPKGAWSTDATTLEDLAAEGHTLPGYLLTWRHLAKLKSTYADALTRFIHPETGRVHTSYAPAATSTGRLASSNPNLQNIPARDDDGRRIRRAFIPEDGWILICADYSQIELRLFAELATIQPMRDAFARGADIHAATAEDVFGDASATNRRRAKAVNFGILYGLSAYGLARQLRLPRAQAQEILDAWQARYPGVRAFAQRTVAACAEIGHVNTMFGRRCRFPNLQSRAHAQRAGAERACVNAPIQGAAADLMRRAMIRMEAAMRTRSMKARMLLQVHDELVFEAPPDERDEVCALAETIMTQANLPMAPLATSLAVSISSGATWDAAH